MKKGAQKRFWPWQVVALVAWSHCVSGCFPGCVGGDPWPPPDPATDSDPNPVTWPADDGPVPRNIFCSAPSPEGLVVLAGLPGAVPRGDRLTVTSASGTVTMLEVSPDGSLAGYVQAQSSERLELVATQSQEQGQSLEVVVRAGRRSGYDGAIDGLVLGSAEDILAPDDEGQVLVHGNGELLRTGSLVVGANLHASTATTTMVSCSPSCAFDLFVPGSSGDEIGLFLVVSGQQSGYTEAETIDVP